MACKRSVLVLVTVLLATGCVTLAKNKKAGGPPAKYAVQVQDSSIDEVPKYGTVIRFNIDLVNKGGTPYEVTVTPEQCCLQITHNDTDCESMQLRPEKTLLLGLVDTYDNITGTASFLFRNLYCRYRKGNCTFIISTKGKTPSKWKHTIIFDTYPTDDEEYEKCTSVDQDPDRSCSPVDCAIKYKGKRNYYRNTIGRCEPVVQCHTRGEDGVSITADTLNKGLLKANIFISNKGTISLSYYDTELNQCHSLDLNSSENAVYLTESFTGSSADTAFMSSLMSSVKGVEVDMDTIALDAMMGSTTPLDCNHGEQEGDLCVCDEGWASSGIDSNLQEHWCDVMDGSSVPFSTGPKRLSYAQEVTAVISLSVLNLLLLVGWVLLVCAIFCRGNKCCCGKQQTSKE